MKYELLKRTAISLFVGGIVSASATAEDTSVEATGVASNLVGVAANSYNNTLTLNGFKAGDDVYDVNPETGKVTKKQATAEDVNNDPLGGKGVINSINDITSDIDELEKNQDEFNEGFRNELDAANQALDEHEAAIAKKANQTDVDALKNRVDGAAAAANLLAQNIGLNKTNIEKKADKTDVDALKNRVDGAAAAANLLAQNIGLNKTNIDANKAALESKADKTALEAKADKTALEAKADKTALEAKADKTALEAKADKTALEAKADKVYVGSLEQNIRDNSNRIETNKVAVSALRNDISSHAKRLDHLDNRVNKLDKDLKRGLATQAALTGLFQPYTVGKANFTAAVGGYKSQTAVAIGTGYRYNKHVATKAGVAFTQGGAAYNVGVNFEW